MLQLFGAGQKDAHVLKRFEENWNCPVGGSEADLFKVFQSLRAFFTKHGTVLREIVKSSDLDPALATRLHQAKVRVIEGNAEAVELRNNQKARVTCDVKLVRELLQKLSDRYQSSGQQAQRQWGREGFEMFDGLQKSLQEDLRLIFAEPTTEASTKPVGLTAKEKSRRGKK